MKIGLIIYGSLDTLSGGYLYDRQLVQHLRDHGCLVEILSLPWRDYPAHLRDNMLIGWARRIAASDFDLLLQDELNHPSLFLLNQLLRRICRCPIISIVHHLRSAEQHPAHLMPIYQMVEKLYLRSVDGFIYNSQTTRHIVEGVLGQEMPGIIAFPAADHSQPPSHNQVIEKIAQRLETDGPLRLVFVGNLMARKGLHTVLNALARLESTSWHLHVVGSHEVDSDYSAGIRHRANTLSLSPFVTWHGRISDEELAKLLLECDVLIMPSYEGFGIVFLEAMACGLPVLAARVGAAPEIVYPGINGYLVEWDDDLSLASKVELLQSNRVHLATLAYHARRRYEEHPTWAQSMDNAYRWLTTIRQTHTD